MTCVDQWPPFLPPCRLDPAVELCEAALTSCPDCCPLLEALAELHLKKETPDKALNVWLSALLSTPHDAHILYSACKFLLSQVRGRWSGHPKLL